MRGRLLALAASALMAATPVLAQEAAAPTDVGEVEVVGSKAPTADAPRSATCEYYISQDPALRAWLSVMSDADPFPAGWSDGAGPSLAVPGPKFYLPTRLPREPDLKSPPRSAPGSALPKLAAKRQYALQTEIVGSIPAEAAAEAGVQPSVTAAGEDEVAASIDACRAQFSRSEQRGATGASAAAERSARARIAANDTTLPMGFALYDEGRFGEALEQFKLAYKELPDADGGDEAGLMVGKIYLLALREKNDPAEAVVWLKKVAGGVFDPITMMPLFDPREPERNTAIGEAAMMLGRLYMTGAGPVAKDPAEARKWFRRAFNVGHVAAAKIVGDMAYAGVGAAPDLKDARAWYGRGARLGHAPSQFAVARMSEAGEGGKADLKTALAWYNEAAKIDHPGALYTLAYAYDKGAGVVADPDRAIGLYKTAALKGDHGAQAALASYFYTGERVEKDHAVARQWFEAAAKGGDAEAMFSLAAMMVRGEGGEVDLVKAWAWLHVARSEDHPKAAAALATLERKMSAEQRKAAASLVGAST